MDMRPQSVMYKSGNLEQVPLPGLMFLSWSFFGAAFAGRALHRSIWFSFAFLALHQVIISIQITKRSCIIMFIIVIIFIPQVHMFCISFILILLVLILLFFLWFLVLWLFAFLIFLSLLSLG